MKQALFSFIGLGSNKTSHQEKLISGLGGFLGIFAILMITRQFVGGHDAVLIVASMGASAVLLFAVPHGPLSQPWALAGGHLISAFIGVSCYLLIPDPFIAAALAVGLAITAMHYLRCIHPPGGATALTAVVAGTGVHKLGYLYMVTPVLLNVLVIIAVAILFNYLFSWRRYPSYLATRRQKQDGKQSGGESQVKESAISRDSLEFALQRLNMILDVSHDDLERIYQLAANRNESKGMSPEKIRLGHYYSNGEYSQNWCVKQIIDESGLRGGERDQVIYKVVAGKGRRNTGTMSRVDFADWAKYEVYLNENSWQRVPQAERKSSHGRKRQV
jgi:CBS-domain-containing membrane protein